MSYAKKQNGGAIARPAASIDRTIRLEVELRRDLENAGATVLDEPCVVDGNLITARFPYDLPRLVDAMVKQLLPTKG